ncbi:MAG: phage holin family protein [Candidatus Staskawiczbacteria bacterium]|nr:phage holin family protein [Candidatus Staskawiczbacteria bacterium]
MKSFLSQVVAAIAGLWLASSFVPNVVVRVYSDSSFFGFGLNAQWQILLILGIILGLLNFFVKPILNAITLPLRIITLGLFSIVVSMAMIWILDKMFAELYVPWLFPLLWTTLSVWALSIIFDFFLKNKNED